MSVPVNPLRTELLALFRAGAWPHRSPAADALLFEAWRYFSNGDDALYRKLALRALDQKPRDVNEIASRMVVLLALDLLDKQQEALHG